MFLGEIHVILRLMMWQQYIFHGRVTYCQSIEMEIPLQIFFSALLRDAYRCERGALTGIHTFIYRWFWHLPARLGHVGSKTLWYLWV